MLRCTSTLLAALAAVSFSSSAAAGGDGWCPPDSVSVGSVCVDRYEASVWTTDRKAHIKRIRRGHVVRADQLRGLTQLGDRAGDNLRYHTVGCLESGAGCTNVYAVSARGVRPSTLITWFQAAAACRNSGKRLARNDEWQAAALGTPDTGGADDAYSTCNTDAQSVTDIAESGSRSACVSDVGAYDMVGNVFEMVADWVPRSTGYADWPGGFTDDTMAMVGAASSGGPGVVLRGGNMLRRARTGPLSIIATTNPSDPYSDVGFRCVRD